MTCLVLSMTESLNFGGRGSDAAIAGGDSRRQPAAADGIAAQQGFTTCVDVGDHVYQKVSAMAAHRTQYPISPDMFPLEMLREMMGKEYFVRILPRPTIEETLFPSDLPRRSGDH